MKTNQPKLGKIILLFLMILTNFKVISQNYNHPKSGSQTVNLPAVNGVYYYYDDGGANANYSDNINNSKITFKVPSGYDLSYKVELIDMNNDGCVYDYLEIDQPFQSCSNDYTTQICDLVQNDGDVYPICGGEVVFTFKSDGIFNDIGWKIRLNVSKRDVSNWALCVNGITEFAPCKDLKSPNNIKCGSSGPTLVLEGQKASFIEEFICWDPFKCNSNGSGDIDFYPPFSGTYPLPERKFFYEGAFEPSLCIETDCPDLIKEIFLVNGCTVLQKGAKVGSNFCFTNVPASTFLKSTYFIAEYDCSGSGDLAFCNIEVNCGGTWNCPDFPDIKCCDVIYSTNADGVSVSNGYNNCYLSSSGSKYTAPEKVYRFVATENGPVTVSLYDLNDDLDLFILDDCDINSGCGNPAKVSHNPGGQDESVTFQAVKGQDYYIVIDGWDGAISDYVLETLCPPAVCNPCGDCFLYTMKNGATSSQVNCFNKYSNCNASVPVTYNYKWFVNGTQASTLENPVLTLNHGSTYQVCQKIFNANVLVFECCWNITPVKPCLDGPKAHYKVSKILNNTVEFDPSTSSDGTKFTWMFGDGSAAVVTNTPDKVSHTFPQSSVYTVCVYVKNDYGIACYCMQIKTGNPNILCQNKLVIPQFTANLNNTQVGINTAQFADIYEYSIDYGDGTNSSGDIWNGEVKHTYPAGKNSYMVCVTYKMKYFDLNGNCCIYYGCFCFTVKVGCCSSVIDNCDAIYYGFLDDIQGLNYQLKHTSGGVQIEGWEIDDVPVANSGSNQINFKFPGAGKYKICCYYYDGAGCLIRCCRWICVSNPFICNEIFYSYIEGQGYQFKIDNSSGDYSEINWTVDAPVNQSLGSGTNSQLLPLPINCQTYTISVRFYDKKCGGYRICCITVYICNPFNCNGIKYYLNSNGDYVFSIDGDVSDASWTFDDTNQNIGSGQTVTYTGPLNCVERIISVRYYDIFCKCWRICCYRIYLCPPSNCSFNINYSNFGFGNIELKSNNSDAQNISWYTLNDNKLIGQGSSITAKFPQGQKIIICMYYYNPVTKCFQVCCKEIMVSPVATQDQTELLEFSIVPNPTKNEFRIQSDNSSESVFLRIFDMNGREVYRWEDYMINDPIILEVPTGLYNVVLSKNKSITHLKLIKVE